MEYTISKPSRDVKDSTLYKHTQSLYYNRRGSIMHTKTKQDVKNGVGTKDDIGKPKMSLLDPNAILGMAKVMEHGLKKYERDNWKKSLNQERILDAIFRHCFAIQDGELIDKESNLLHSYHIGCGAMMLSWSQNNESV